MNETQPAYSLKHTPVRNLDIISQERMLTYFYMHCVEENSDKRVGSAYFIICISVAEHYCFT